MKYVDEYRDADAVHAVIAQIRAIMTRPVVLMEICGGQTHSIIRYGIDQLLPPELELVHGPGCPVCVTPLELVDQAIAIAGQPGVIFCSFGDMLRVPGSTTDLFGVRAQGGDVRILYSPLDALKIARENPDRQVVFFGVGFETTAPANAMAILEAHRQDLLNFSMLVSHVRVPPAIHAMLSSPSSRIEAFLAAGHVCTVMGYWEYESLALEYDVPIVVTAFEPLDMVRGIFMAVKQVMEGRAEVENAYNRVVTRDGNATAQQMIRRVFASVDRKWRGIGTIAQSGWAVKPEFARFDATRRFDIAHLSVSESLLCLAGKVLQGLIKPVECPAFGTKCTPRHPLGAPMVSSEGACAAYYQYGRFRESMRKT